MLTLKREKLKWSSETLVPSSENMENREAGCFQHIGQGEDRHTQTGSALRFLGTRRQEFNV